MISRVAHSTVGNIAVRGKINPKINGNGH